MAHGQALILLIYSVAWMLRQGLHAHCGFAGTNEALIIKHVHYDTVLLTLMVCHNVFFLL